YVLKSSSSGELIDAVHYVLDGNTYLHPSIARKAMQRVKERNVGRARKDSCDLLTPREATVLYLMGKGCKNKEIATKLFLSEETVKTHVSHILMKLDQPDRMQAVLFAIRNNLIALDCMDDES
ncbi:hypothetical protein LCGC14_1942920, partial [marine sediment metagenome]